MTRRRSSTCPWCSWYDSISNIVVAGSMRSAYAESAVGNRLIETSRSSAASARRQRDGSGQAVRIELPLTIRPRTG